MKSIYITPQSFILQMDNESSLLTSSVNIDKGNTITSGNKDGFTLATKKFDYTEFDEEDEEE